MRSLQNGWRSVQNKWDGVPFISGANNIMNILFFGDIYGRPGRKAVNDFLSNFKQENNIDVCIANCENLTDGKGVSEPHIHEMLEAGIDMFSSGNHLWDRKESLEYIKTESRIAKPLNYPKASYGFNYAKKMVNSIPVYIVTLCGQAFMTPVDSPVYALEDFLNSIEHQEKPRIVVVDFHAESTAEKKALALYFDGKVSAVLGTHTHVQTADEEILDKGTAYITDVGMCGPHKSVIGIEAESTFQRFLTNMPVKHETAKEGLLVNAVLFHVDETTGKSTNITRIRI